MNTFINNFQDFATFTLFAHVCVYVCIYMHIFFPLLKYFRTIPTHMSFSISLSKIAIFLANHSAFVITYTIIIPWNCSSLSQNVFPIALKFSICIQSTSNRYILVCSQIYLNSTPLAFYTTHTCSLECLVLICLFASMRWQSTCFSLSCI